MRAARTLKRWPKAVQARKISRDASLRLLRFSELLGTGGQLSAAAALPRSRLSKGSCPICTHEQQGPASLVRQGQIVRTCRTRSFGVGFRLSGSPSLFCPSPYQSRSGFLLKSVLQAKSCCRWDQAGNFSQSYETIPFAELLPHSELQVILDQCADAFMLNVQAEGLRAQGHVQAHKDSILSDCQLLGKVACYTVHWKYMGWCCYGAPSSIKHVFLLPQGRSSPMTGAFLRSA